ncbi:MAG: TcfC E-set like domain-containing protein, partial [Kangiellaceae bacterium]|nr:TcfC E-set like domain-containing protein [Kangiellaceae bacterium]
MKKLLSLLSLVCGIFCLSWLLSANSLHAAEPSSTEENVITTGVPEGFDDLLEEQLALVDIYYQGSLVNSVMARYTPDSLSFESPEELVNNLPNIANPGILISQLTLPQDTNPSLVCFYPEQANCGVLNPAIAAIIFDESNMRVDLFVNPQLLSKSILNVDKYLPPSTSGTSMINSFSFVAAGGDEREEVYTAQLSTIVGFDNYRVVSNIESDNENGGRLDQLSLIYEYRDLAYQVGTFRSLTQPGGFYQQRDFVGFRINTSLASRTDLEQVSGSRVFVFLNERSQVEVYKDGQLIDSQIYQAGNVELDTREFPQGAYNVELRITGDSGRERSETHFYSKSFLLPPKNETIYFAELGFPEADQTESYPVASE